MVSRGPDMTHSEEDLAQHIKPGIFDTLHKKQLELKHTFVKMNCLCKSRTPPKTHTHKKEMENNPTPTQSEGKR